MVLLTSVYGGLVCTGRQGGAKIYAANGLLDRLSLAGRNPLVILYYLQVRDGNGVITTSAVGSPG